jgi:hypothetical protein
METYTGMVNPVSSLAGLSITSSAFFALDAATISPSWSGSAGMPWSVISTSKPVAPGWHASRRTDNTCRTSYGKGAAPTQATPNHTIFPAERNCSAEPKLPRQYWWFGNKVPSSRNSRGTKIEQPAFNFLVRCSVTTTTVPTCTCNMCRTTGLRCTL